MTIGVRYLGWSGFRIDWPEGPTMFIDPPETSALPCDRECWVALTHGHPEHVAGTAAHLADSQRAGAVHVLASPRVCAHLRRDSRHAGDRFHAMDPDSESALPGLCVQAFAWRHMPLLPPEPSLAARHVARLARHPGITFGIVKDGLTGPPPGAMLGFRFAPEQGPRVLVYSEGLHRRTPVGEVRTLRERLPAELLLFAVEPEDAAELPDLVAAVGALDVVPYEAHRDWREGLGMPQADLVRLARELDARGVRAHVLDRGRSAALPLRERTHAAGPNPTIQSAHVGRPDHFGLQASPSLERSSR
jgi:hypothetical protein